MTDERPPVWVSARAVAWVLDSAPVSSDLALTLLAIARACDAQGRGSRQSAPTIAEKVGKSLAQVKKEIRLLREQKLIIPGDPSLVARIPAGQRPVVYDVNLDLVGPKPMKESRNRSGKKKAADVTNSLEATSGMEATRSLQAPSDGAPELRQGVLGSIGTGSSGATQRRSEEDLEQQDLQEQDQNLNPPTPRAEPTAPAVGLVDVVEDRGGVPSDVGETGETAAGERVPAQRDGDPVERRAQRAEVRRLAWQAVTARARQLAKTDQASIAANIIKVLRAGWTFAEVTAELDRELPQPPYELAAVFIGRLQKLGDPPPAVDPVDLTPCPIGGHYDYQTGQQFLALKCNNCRADVKAGFDPFNGRHDERHPDWPETYGWDPPALDAEDMPLDPAVRADMFAKLAALSARLDMDEALDAGSDEAADVEPVGAGEMNPW